MWSSPQLVCVWAFLQEGWLYIWPHAFWGTAWMLAFRMEVCSALRRHVCVATESCFQFKELILVKHCDRQSSCPLINSWLDKTKCSIYNRLHIYYMPNEDSLYLPQLQVKVASSHLQLVGGYNYMSLEVLEIGWNAEQNCTLHASMLPFLKILNHYNFQNI